ncbi:MAG: acyltransferase [Lachnospiraceae bacterium]|nr:acyltransferase [Lachnospiraceae bacterium]
MKTRNYSIDIFRYVCAVMVVAIHTRPFSDLNEEIGFIFTQIVPRIAVPFFFCVAGYYYIPKLEKGYKSFSVYIKRLIITYSTWSCFYYIIDFLQYGYLDVKGFISRSLYKFAISGSYYHFWFFPALIFAVCFTTFLFKIGYKKVIIPLSIVLYCIGCLGCSYYKLGICIPGLRTVFTFSGFNVIRRVLCMGFPFFLCGYLVYKIKEKVFAYTTNIKLFVIWIISVGVWLTEICLVLVLKLESNIVITIGLYLLCVMTMLILLRNQLSKYKAFSNISRILANFTYYSHPFWIIFITFLCNNIFHVNITETPIFFLAIGLSCIVGILLYRWDNRVMNHIIK